MRGSFMAIALAWALLAVAQAADAPPLPRWAFTQNPPGAAAPPPDLSALHRVPNSTVQMTLKQVRDTHNIPDWHPDNHPPMPNAVKHGRDDLFGCGYCHLPNGQGRPENAPVAGLPAAYIVQQVADFRAGTRRSSDDKAVPAQLMTKMAVVATEAEVREAAEYFASLTFRPWIRVVETDTVPKNKVQGFMFVAIEGGGTEPIGTRVIEMPENLEATELRDSGSGFVAYVPKGAVKRGEALAKGENGKSVACATCHGAGMKGLGPVPPLAGRSPSYLARQLFDLQQGARAGLWSPLMGPVVAKLTEADMVDLVAYLASLKP